MIAKVATLVLSVLADAQSGTHYSPIAPQPVTQPTLAVVEETDHEESRLHPGLGYFGRIDAPLGDRIEPAQLIGMRYWFRRRLGIDVAIGGSAQLGSASSSASRGPSLFVIAARVSLPIALVVTKHLVLFLAPTIAFTQAGESVPADKALSPITGLERTPPDTRRGGTRLSLGGRIGAELHLGFLGAARLSFIGTFGLDADWRRVWTAAPSEPTSVDPEPRAIETRGTRLSARTTFAEDPWAALLGNVSLVAYF